MEPFLLEVFPERDCCILPGVMRDDNRAYIQSSVLEFGCQTKHIFIIGNPDIAAHLVFDDIFRADDDHQLGKISQLQQHLKLAVRRKAGKHPGCVQIVKQLPPEFQIQLVSELSDPLPDVFRLNLQIFVIIKPDFHSLLSFYPLAAESFPAERILACQSVLLSGL